MPLLIPEGSSKEKAIEIVRNFAGTEGLQISEEDTARPWGAFFVIDQSSVVAFIQRFFDDLPEEQIFQYGQGIRPKLLLVEPNQKLSWQYHYRRAELWKVISGPVGVVESDTDEQGPLRAIEASQLISHGAEARHRLIGLSNWGIIAEIWQHTDPSNLSNEEDIVRLEDDFGRN